MRRALSILLILLFSAGPLSFALNASEDVSLPACCRRHGAHHCAMGSMEGASGNASDTIIKTPSHCPQFPQRANARTSTYAAPSHCSYSHRVIACETERFAPSATGLTSIHLRTPVLRGPPASPLA